MFKQLTHIFLQTRIGNDASIKAYLAARLGLATATCRRQATDLQDLTAMLEADKATLLALTNEMKELKTHRETDEQMKQAAHAQEISTLQINHIQTLDAERQRFGAQLESLRLSLETAQRELASRGSTFEQQIAELNHAKNTLEYKVLELTRQLRGTEDERDRVVAENQKIYASKVEVEQLRITLERDVARNIAKVEALNQQLEDKAEMVAKSVALQKASEEARVSLEQKLELYMNNGEVLQEKLLDSGREIEKGNKVIGKLQDEVKQLRDKIKTKSEVIRRQESLINDLRSKLGDTERQMGLAQDTLASAKNEALMLQRQLADANAKLDESTKLVASNQEVITYLNEEINKWQLGLRTHTDAFSPSAMKSDVNIVSFSPDSVMNARTPGSYTSSNVGNVRLSSTRAVLSSSSSSSRHTPSQLSPEWDAEPLEGLTSKDIYMQGLENLGLANSFGLDLQALDYYATGNIGSLPASGVTAGQTASPLNGAGATGSKKVYDWQSDSFGRE